MIIRSAAKNAAPFSIQLLPKKGKSRVFPGFFLFSFVVIFSRSGADFCAFEKRKTSHRHCCKRAARGSGFYKWTNWNQAMEKNDNIKILLLQDILYVVVHKNSSPAGLTLTGEKNVGCLNRIERTFAGDNKNQ